MKCGGGSFILCEDVLFIKSKGDEKINSARKFIEKIPVLEENLLKGPNYLKLLLWYPP